MEMLSYNHGSELQDIEYRSDHRVEVNSFSIQVQASGPPGESLIIVI